MYVKNSLRKKSLEINPIRIDGTKVQHFFHIRKKMPIFFKKNIYMRSKVFTLDLSYGAYTLI